MDYIDKITSFHQALRFIDKYVYLNTHKAYYNAFRDASVYFLDGHTITNELELNDLVISDIDNDFKEKRLTHFNSLFCTNMLANFTGDACGTYNSHKLKYLDNFLMFVHVIQERNPLNIDHDYTCHLYYVDLNKAQVHYTVSTELMNVNNAPSFGQVWCNENLILKTSPDAVEIYNSPMIFNSSYVFEKQSFPFLKSMNSFRKILNKGQFIATA